MNIFFVNIFNKCEYTLYNYHIHEYILLMNIFMNTFLCPVGKNFLIQFKINEHEYIHEHFYKFIFIFMNYVLDHTGTF